MTHAHDVLELPEREVEDVFLLTQHAAAHEALGFLQQRLLVDEVAADDTVLRILAVSHERPDAVDHAPDLLGLLFAVRHGTKPPQHIRLLLSGRLPSLLEAPLAFARL